MTFHNLRTSLLFSILITISCEETRLGSSGAQRNVQPVKTPEGRIIEDPVTNEEDVSHEASMDAEPQEGEREVSMRGACGEFGQPCCESETCEDGSCSRSVNCRNGLTCAITEMNGVVTTECEDPADCGEVGERCCVDDSDCADGGVCDSNTCVSCGQLGESCCDDQSCREGYCEAGMCVAELACGYLGRECCQDRCIEGSCLEGQCAMFGGAYAELTLANGSELISNPYTGQGCPPEFTAHRVLDSWLEIGSTERSVLYTCLSESEPQNGSGAYIGHAAYSAEPICIESCDHFGEASSCECDEEDEEMTIKTLSLDPSDLCASLWTWCAVESALSSNFGGTYVLVMPDPNNSSACGECVPNPMTDSCGCPGRMQGLRIPIVYLASGLLCRTCNADLVDCMASPQ